MADVLPALADTPDGVDADAWTAACAAVRAYCGWHVAPSFTESVTLDGPGTGVLLLPTLHLTALADVTNDGAAVSDPEWSQAGMVRGSWTGRYRGITATMTHGYETCPGEILGVLREAASRGITGSAVSQVGQVRMGGVDGVPGAASFMLEQQAVLDRYVLPVRS
ncbi:hypothetical protein [Terrabacter terrigena]|uniref:Head-to-tail adaptor n=1 Tax=Terrabacter terrigena TaxID=574718 RepID=A0ABW3MWT2_9MICO